MRKIKGGLIGYILILLAIVVLVVLVKYQVMPPAKEKKLLCMDFKDANIHNVLRLIGHQAGLNIIADPELTGTVTVSFRDVTAEDALDAILKVRGFGYERKKNIIRVVRLTKEIPQIEAAGESSGQEKAKSNIAIVTKIAEDYHKSHTYSFHDLFVCGDMAIDVWNQIKTKSINATIAVGNVEKLTTSIKDFNHVWVLAETSPFKWLAVETTAGRVIYRSENPVYYQYPSFNTPAELKKYLELTKEYNRQVNEVEKLDIYDPIYHREVQKLRDISNKIKGLLY